MSLSIQKASDYYNYNKIINKPVKVPQTGPRFLTLIHYNPCLLVWSICLTMLIKRTESIACPPICWPHTWLDTKNKNVFIWSKVSIDWEIRHDLFNVNQQRSTERQQNCLDPYEIERHFHVRYHKNTFIIIICLTAILFVFLIYQTSTNVQ